MFFGLYLALFVLGGLWQQVCTEALKETSLVELEAKMENLSNEQKQAVLDCYGV